MRGIEIMHDFSWQCSRCRKRCVWPCDPDEYASIQQAVEDGHKPVCHACVKKHNTEAFIAQAIVNDTGTMR